MKKSSMRFWRMARLSAAILLSFMLLAGCRDEPGSEKVQRPAVTGITTATIEPVSVNDMYETTGTVRSERTSIVSSRTMGVITSLLVREGDVVKAGRLLLTIDSRDADQRAKAASMAVESAQQSKELAEVTWQRYKNLYDEKALSKQEMDQIETRRKIAETEYERARAMADEAKTYQAYSKVTAPVSGRVTRRHTEVGSMASPGMPLLVIEGGGKPYIEATVDERLGGAIKPGTAVEVTIDAINRSLQETVREIVPAVDPLSRTFLIKISLDDGNVESGLFARLKIPVGTKEVLLAPGKAIVRKGQLTGAYVVNNEGIIAYRLIRTGASYPQGVEILSGLVRGDRIVTDGVDKVVDGGIVHGGSAQ